MYEIWFRRTAGQAALEAGIACVPGAMLGSFIGGVIVKVFKLNGRQMMYASSLCAVMVFGFYTAGKKRLTSSGVTSQLVGDLIFGQKKMSEAGIELAQVRFIEKTKTRQKARSEASHQKLKEKSLQAI